MAIRSRVRPRCLAAVAAAKGSVAAAAVKWCPATSSNQRELATKGVARGQGIQLYRALDLSIVGEQERDARQGDHQFPELLAPACPFECSSEMLPGLGPVSRPRAAIPI